MMATVVMVVAVTASLSAMICDADMVRQGARLVPLPDPRLQGETSVEAALVARKSLREYSGGPLSLAELSQLLWAAQGVTHAGAGRTAPSAGALYPIELYVVAGNVENLGRGVYRYRIGSHDLVEVMAEDLQAELAAAALGQESVEDAAAVIVVAGVIERTAQKYGQRAVRYVHMEVGAVVENVYLQATALGLGTVFVGAFSDTKVKQVLGMPDEESPFALLPVGRASR
jgi:SagB-type dehydrogenase family enzyme